MAVSFVARKCTQCAGKLQYIKEKKLWRCLYCGAEIERQEQYDGLFTIKNVVRQTLRDTAYRRLDSAEKNLIECEKIDSRYVGTLIAKLSYDMIRVSTPGACDPRDMKAIFAQLRKSYDQLKEIGATVTDEEEALYEFLEESDIFATLVLVYDSLADTARRDFVAQLLNPDDVFSKPANNNLLSYALKNGNCDLADQVIANPDNLELKAALSEVLAKYPDGEAKGARIASLIAAGAIGYEDRRIFEEYLSTSQDSVATKSRGATAALEAQIPIRLELLLAHVLNRAEPDAVGALLGVYCKTKLGDEDVIRILSFAYECETPEAAFVAMDRLEESDQYVSVPAKLLISMLSGGHSVEHRCALLERSLAFKVDHKALDAVFGSFLCENQDPPEARMAILTRLLGQVTSIPTATVETYVLKCSADGENKPEILRLMFEKGLNVSFFHDLMSRYVSGSPDAEPVREKIVAFLTGQGLALDAGELGEYILTSADAPDVKLKFVQRMIANGAQLRADVASAYLERTDPALFSSELFSAIVSPGSTFSARAVENYILRLPERAAIKAENVKTILERTPGNVLDAAYQVVHLEHTVVCNLLQAYVLITTDPEATAMEIAEFFLRVKRMKINAEIRVGSESMKFKKYVVANKERLGAVTDAICEKYKVYSMLF